MSAPRETTGPRSCRVYVIQHDNGCLTGILMRQWNVFFDQPPPSAYGRSLDEVLQAIDVELAQRAAAGVEPLERYLWSEAFQMRSVTIEVRPQTFVDKRPVIGLRSYPLTLQYAACQLRGGAWRVGLPRFGWWMVLESLELAGEALGNALGAALLGQQDAVAFAFRRDGKEHVREWTSRLVSLEPPDATEDDDAALASLYPTMVKVADEMVSRARARKVTGTHGVWPGILDYRLEHPWSTLVIGPPGVGKSTRIRQFARQLAQRRRGKKDADARRLWHTSRDRILAGMMFLGMWEERVLAMIGELRARGDWLWVERLADLLEPVGGSTGGTIGELLLPAIENKELFLISEATQEEYDRLVRKHPRWYDALAMSFVSPPDDAALAGWVPSFAESAELKQGRARGTAWERTGLRRLTQLQARFEPGVAQPGKAARFVDWWVRTTSPTGTPSGAMDADAVTEAYARYSGLPIDMVSDRHPTTATALRRSLEARVVGQGAAAEVAARVIARFRAGLSDPQRPIATLLFVGPTGVGKTELAKAMSHVMFGSDAKMIRLDMSEYHLPWSAERLFQIGRGVTSLAERVRQQPIALVLLDEIEKAHPTIFDTLMAVLDEGRLTDQTGAVVDFRTTLIVMTSNLGAGGPRATGFATGMGAGPGVDYFGAARRWFRPELLNRIDHVVPFASLSRADIDVIVDLELARVAAREGFTRRGLALEVGPDVRALLAAEGYHPDYGARALRRVIEDRLVVPLASLLARTPELVDLTLVASARDGELVFDTRLMR
ncbi:MAG: AAA family ATPase [Deltaproteobacteria bacterium]|nr:AAA family ATPase [Deltaproteobacteria bacterium]